MTILITLLTLTATTFFLIGNYYHAMQHRVHKQKKTITNLQKQLRAKNLKSESRENSLKNEIKEAERKLSDLKKAIDFESS